MMFVFLALLTSLTMSWDADISTDPINDSRVVFLSSASVSGVNKHGNRMYLCIRFTEEEGAVTNVDLYVSECGYLGNRGVSVTSRIDSEDPVTKAWRESNNGTAMFYPDNPAYLIKELIDGSNYVVRFTPYSDNQRTITFSLMGLTNAIASNLSDYHGWIGSVENAYQAILFRGQEQRETFLANSLLDGEETERIDHQMFSVGDTILIRSAPYLILDVNEKDDEIEIEPIGGNSHSGTDWISQNHRSIVILEPEISEDISVTEHDPEGTLNTSVLLLDGERYLIREIDDRTNRVLLYPQNETGYSGPSEGTWVDVSYEGIELIFE